MTEIRTAKSEEGEAIQRVYLSAFPSDERERIAQLAIDLLSDASQPETLSLVAEQDGAVVGHVAFSPVFVDGDTVGYLLAPLAVLPEWQGVGIGSQLVRQGIAQLQRDGVALLFVYGDPDYYGRFGFDADAADDFLPSYPLQQPFGWQMRMLGKRYPVTAPAMLSCVDALQDPTLW